MAYIVILLVCFGLIIYYVNKGQEKQISNKEKIKEISGMLQDLEDECNPKKELINSFEESNMLDVSKEDNNLISSNDDIKLNSIIDNNIPSNIAEITNNQYEVLKMLNGANIKYALTGIINVYHNDLPKLLEKFKEFDLIRYSNIEEAIQKLTIKEIKKYLRNKNLKLVGNKKDLIDRLLPNLNENEQKEILVQNKCYILTEMGNQLITEYKDMQEKELQELFKHTIELFKAKQIKEAYKRICEYNVKYNSVGGLNFDWKEQLEKGIAKVDYDVTNWFMDKEIEVDTDIELNNFKAIICFSILDAISYNKTIQLIQDVYNYDEDITNIQYFSTMISNEREALDLEELDFEYYEIIRADDSCSKCKNKVGKKLKLSNRKVGVNFPPICKNCRCTISAYFDE